MVLMASLSTLGLGFSQVASLEKAHVDMVFRETQLSGASSSASGDTAPAVA